MKGCESCQQNKIIRQPLSTQLHPNLIPTKPWEIVSMDFIGPLPMSNNFNMIMVIVDRLSKRGIFIPIYSTITAAGTAKEIRDHLVTKHGFPRIIISNRGPQFASNFMKEITTQLGIQQNISTAYHPQC